MTFMSVAKRATLAVAMVAAAVPLTLSGGSAGASDVPVDPLHAEVAVAPGAAPTRTPGLTDSLLREAVARQQAGQALPGGVQAAGGRVVVEVHAAKTVAGLTPIVESVGGTVLGGVDGWFAQASVPLAALQQLEDRPDVDFVKTPTRADLIDDTPVQAASSVQAGAAAGEHIAKTHAGDWIAAGVTGAGVKVGIIDYFDQTAWNAAFAGGDVPAPAGTRCKTNGSNCNIFLGGTEHGVAVAEVVHDVAPAAQLYLATADTTADLQNVVNWMIANGVKIITRSLGSELDGPGDGTGPTADIVDDAVAAGITWFNSAGNKGGNSENAGAYWRGTVSGSLGVGDLVEFAPGDTLMGFYCGFLQGVRWDDWGLNPTDYDVEVYYDQQPADGVLDLVGGSANNQAGGADPVETNIDCVPGQVNYLAIRVFDPGDGTAGDVLEIHLNAGILEYWQNPYSVTQPAADSASPGMVTVGAIGDNPFGGTLAFYSSRGPTNDGRLKPDLAAASCLTTVAYGAQCFNGTSAATPVAAGLAALVIDAGLATTPAKVKQYLVDHTVDRGMVGPDQAYGAGELILPDGIVSLTPTRVFDTRPGQSAGALRSVPKTRIGGSTVLTVKMTDLAGRVPATGVAAVSLNVVATGSTNPGFITVYPCDTRKQVSSVNFLAGQTVANAVIAPVSDSGEVCFFSPTKVDVIADINGYYAATSAFEPVSPERVFDTRPGQSPSALRTVAKRQIDGTVLEVKLTDLPGVVPASGVEAVSLNVVATGTAGPGYINVYPCGTRKQVSSVNFTGAGQTVANAVIAPVSSKGTVCFFSPTGVDVIADVNGWFATSPVFTPVSPDRLLDTRPGQSPNALRSVAKRQIGGGNVLTVDVTGLPGGVVPGSGVAAVSLNVVATGTSGPGYVTVYPCGPRGGVSSLNFSGAGQTIANAVMAPVSAAGTICLFASTPTDVVVDINGWFAG